MNDDKTNDEKPRQIRLISEFDSLSEEEKEEIRELIKKYMEKKGPPEKKRGK